MKLFVFLFLLIAFAFKEIIESRRKLFSRVTFSINNLIIFIVVTGARVVIEFMFAVGWRHKLLLRLSF